MSHPQRKRSLPRVTVIWAVTAIFLFLALFLVTFWAQGGRYFAVETPSMGQAAPVGSMVFSLPTPFSRLVVGDIISFHPPTSPSETYTHRIVAISSTGVTTRGDNNGIADPWRVTSPFMIGRVAFVGFGVGWLTRCIPLLTLGFALVWFITRYLRSPTRRSAFRIGGYAFVFAMTVAIVRPFVRMLLLTATAAHGRAHANLVSTGILPIRVTAVGGTFVDLLSGQKGAVSVATVAKAHYQIGADLNLTPLGWILFFACCGIPLFSILLVGLPRDTVAGAILPQ